MTQVLGWLKKRTKLFKFIFLLSVSVIVVREVLTIAKTTSLSQLQDVLTALHPLAVVAMGIVGLIAVMPMLFYDVILTNLLPDKPALPYVLQTSWITNTINNLCGFGGLISTGLRTQFYGKKTQGQELLKALSKVILFFMSGISIYCLLSLLLVWFGHTDPFLHKYWLWLIGGSLYFPILLIVTHRSEIGFFDDLTLKIESQLVGTSFLEWTGVLTTFISVGKLMGLDFSIGEVIPLYIACSIIGMVSMIPGALGSFDVMMLLGLSALGVPHESAVIWILLYRLFYYLIPFAIGLLLLTHNVGDQFNQRYNGIPKEAASKVAHYALVTSLYIAGSLLVLSATIPEAFSDYPIIGKWTPASFHFLTQTPSLIFGFLLLAMGRGAAQKVKKAFMPTVILLLSAVIYVIWKEFSWGLVVILVLVLLFVVLSRSQFYRVKLVYSWEMLTFDGLLYSSLAFLYVVIGVYNLPHRHHRVRHDFLVFPSEHMWLLGLLTIVITATLLLIFGHYLSKSNITLGETVNQEKVMALLDEFGGNETSQLIFLGDKELFFYEVKGKPVVLFQYKLKADKCLVMGEPVGDATCFLAAIEAFMEKADTLGYRLVFYEVQESFVMLLHEQGFDFLKMGEEAYVDVQNFTLSGKKLKGVRSLINKMDRDNYQFEWLEPPFSVELMKELRQISDEWLAGQAEKSYSMGYFDEVYLSRAPIGVIKDRQGRCVAFANSMPTYNQEQMTIDLMRHYRDAPSGVMDSLFTHLFDVAKEQGYQFFNMGMAPLANVGYAKNSFFQERVAHYIYEYGTHFYSFQGLRNYKSKYATRWVAKYTAYPKNSSLIFTLIQLLILVNAPKE
ncbi:bifunctional lysylphosphatidylglycerol flippase/synthetase MprF [Vagococcus sp. BWB3-3]|uniref:Phosphatidylglycerol lysyltransferase n=1 Tax=Vagococcus allomyrinae TaxID=2794353 RepID=A0A940P6J5_9ENTE|nr:bifunctional lysylphosphatidylglycerol flippase/synthetase MprF [Vagococcus allomyrinae]MBP1039399.1 bifunctional lysylphosphatidylglycerol flippase/synthetase MprF [Vagococcus allomyrinae]